MEKYMSTCRIILVCESTSKIIQALISRCLLIRCSAPSNEQMVHILQHVANREFGGRSFNSHGLGGLGGKGSAFPSSRGNVVGSQYATSVSAAFSSSSSTSSSSSSSSSFGGVLPTLADLHSTDEQIQGMQSVLPLELALRLTHNARGSIRRALLMLDACHAVKPFPSTPSGASVAISSSLLSSQGGGGGGGGVGGSGGNNNAGMPIPVPDWEVAVDEIATLAVTEQSSKRILEIRKRLYEVLVHLVPADVLFKRLADRLWEVSDTSLKDQIAYWAAFFEHRCTQGMKPVIHIEAFITKYMSLQKEFTLLSYASSPSPSVAAGAGVGGNVRK